MCHAEVQLSAVSITLFMLLHCSVYDDAAKKKKQELKLLYSLYLYFLKEMSSLCIFVGFYFFYPVIAMLTV